MEEIIVKRRKYFIKKYRVPVTIEMKEQALNFAKELISGNNQYLRLTTPQGKNDKDMQRKIEVQRTYVGKVAELAFKSLLDAKKIETDVTNMFDIYEGQHVVDDFDFATKKGSTIDIKAGFREIHSRLLINLEQFNNVPKDYYVGVKLNAKDTDYNNKLVDWNSIKTATIEGYAEHDYLNKHVGVKDFGEGDAKHLAYNSLLGIDKLLELM